MTAFVRNRVGWRERLAVFQGSTVSHGLDGFDKPLAEISALESEVSPIPDDELARRAAACRNRIARSGDITAERTEMFALVREASRRALGLRPFDVQVIAALAMNDGAVVEMQTGEGKTLAAVMPAALNALAGRGVHVLTFNDYLARRDAEWMGPIYARLGLSAAFVQDGMSPADRRRAYAADVTYVTAKQAGFDHLRDQLATSIGELVHRPFHFALVDEADSLLIDEARVPLVIAGSVERRTVSATGLPDLVSSLTPDVHYTCDDYARNVELTDAGFERLEAALGRGSLLDDRNLALLTDVNCALHAHVLLRRDVDYIVRNGRIEIVDEFTGRVVHDRHWPDGLQAAIEAKERIDANADGQILGTMTVQHFLRSYPHLCGMTGTARDAARELAELYDLAVVVVPTNRPMVRIDHPDVVFTHREAKEAAIVAEVQRVHASRRPVLVGTLTVEESERLSERLLAAGVPCQTLNARNDEMEASVIARAGEAGAVTISTNMAGRGTDIRLGGPDERERDHVTALGGLYVIGTNRHDSRRVDLQLRGRAGRQGDPGESRFFISLDDDLLVRYRVRELIPPWHMPAPSGAPIENAVVRREVARAQRIIEGQNLEIRRTLGRYSDLLDRQRQHVIEWRQALLAGNEAPQIWRTNVERYGLLVRAAGEEAVANAERAVSLAQLDRLWREHLALCADLREGIHLVGLGGKDPLTQFMTEATQAFRTIEDRLESAMLAALDRVGVTADGLDLSALAIKGPSSTWTYLVNDDPFRNQLAMKLMGPGRTTFAITAAVFFGPLLLLWALVDRFRGKTNRT